jgi:hypothetical protein
MDIPEEFEGDGGSPGRFTYFFRPFSRVERPVPPPIATTRKYLVADGLSVLRRITLRGAMGRP